MARDGVDGGLPFARTAVRRRRRGERREGRRAVRRGGAARTAVLFATPHVWPHLPLTPQREAERIRDADPRAAAARRPLELRARVRAHAVRRSLLARGSGRATSSTAPAACSSRCRSRRRDLVSRPSRADGEAGHRTRRRRRSRDPRDAGSPRAAGRCQVERDLADRPSRAGASSGSPGAARRGGYVALVGSDGHRCDAPGASSTGRRSSAERALGRRRHAAVRRVGARLGRLREPRRVAASAPSYRRAATASISRSGASRLSDSARSAARARA